MEAAGHLAFSSRVNLQYLSLVSDVALKHRVDIHAYVLMANAVHFLVSPETAVSTARLMQSLGRRHVRFLATDITEPGRCAKAGTNLRS